LKLANALAKIVLIVAPCLGSTIGPPDASCDPKVDPPVTGSCVWYNFYALADGSIQAGSSFQSYYIAADNPAWTITSTSYDLLRVLDGGHQGDTFDVFDHGIFLGTTSATPVDINHACAGDQTGPGFDPAACWNDPLMSRGTFLLPPGSHSLTVVWDQRVPGGNSTLQWFEIGAAATMPEPGTLLLTGFGLIAVAYLVGRRRSSRS